MTQVISAGFMPNSCAMAGPMKAMDWVSKPSSSAMMKHSPTTAQRRPVMDPASMMSLMSRVAPPGAVIGVGMGFLACSDGRLMRRKRRARPQGVRGAARAASGRRV